MEKNKSDIDRNLGINQFINHMGILDLGFRPFYFLAVIWGLFTVLEWILELHGRGFRNTDWMLGLHWHAHEMIFGFAGTVISGFALTAVRSWTGLETPTNFSLFVLVAIWLCARIGVFEGSILVVLDVIFLPLIAVIIGRLLVKKRMYINLFLPFMLFILGILNALIYASVQVWIKLDIDRLLISSLFCILLIAIIISNRIIPSFTLNTNPNISQFKNQNLTNVTMFLSGLTFLSIIFNFNEYITFSECILVSFCHSVMLWGWRPQSTLRKPMLLILHISYAWMPFGFLLLGLTAIGLISIYPAIHVFGIGVASGLIISMITRTSLAHTGRVPVAGRIEEICYISLQLCLIAWLISFFVSSVWFYGVLFVSGLFWIITFLLYILKYTPILFMSKLTVK